MFWKDADPSAARPFYEEALRHTTVAVGNLDEVEVATGVREPPPPPAPSWTPVSNSPW